MRQKSYGTFLTYVACFHTTFSMIESPHENRASFFVRKRRASATARAPAHRQRLRFMGPGGHRPFFGKEKNPLPRLRGPRRPAHLGTSGQGILFFLKRRA